ncbi:putative dsRNA-binding protein [Flavobacteriaceae bacterium]|jgi:ribonuclease III|nr:putative dsRNA-binding protein [Flavobacteriaceae bacterium]MDC1492094.1 putative dsRNA-binding protein [Flavobacteriaceae bacterium]
MRNSILNNFNLFNKKDNFYFQIKNLLNFTPNSIDYYKRAFTHRSLNEKDINGFAINYERLEFLGDSILSSIISTYLFNQIPEASEGYLTKMRSKIVSRKHLNELGLELNLKKHLTSDLNIDNYGENIDGNLFESLIGAIFLDKGYKYAKRFIFQSVIIPHVDLEKLDGKIISYKTLIIEWCQKKKLKYDYETYEDSGNDSVKHFTSSLKISSFQAVRARSTSKKKAEEKVSQRAFYINQNQINI